MDEVILRFPHLGVQIFQELDVGSLLNCKQIGRSWENFIETEKPLNDKFVIMRLVYGYCEALPTCLDWVENNFDYIMYKFKRRGIGYNIAYMRIILPRLDLKNLQLETEFDGRRSLTLSPMTYIRPPTPKLKPWADLFFNGNLNPTTQAKLWALNMG